MTNTEKKNFARNEVISKIGIEAIGTQIDSSVWAVPVEVEGETKYVKVTLTNCADKDITYKTGAKAGQVLKAFDLDTAVEKWNQTLAEREAKKKEKKEKNDAAE